VASAKVQLKSATPVTRKFENWMDAWMEYTDPLPSPALWRKWSGISAVAATLERKVWIKTAFGLLYPNMYIVLVGPPGAGKTMMTNTVWHMLDALSDGSDGGFHLASSSLTSASIIDDLRGAKRRIIQPDMAITEFHSLAIVSNELGVLLPEYDNSFMSKLTDIYDGHQYSERRRTKELQFKIEHPQLNLLAATTPSYLNGMLPEGAWDQGFLSRTMIVYSGETTKRSIFAEQKLHGQLQKDLQSDLRAIFNTYGKITWSEEAMAGVENWAEKGGPPAPEHPKLQHYNSRRNTHLLKLCMVAAVCAGRKEITVDDFHTALDWLLELEAYLPDVFKSMVVGGDSAAMKECWYAMGVQFAKTGEPVSETLVVTYLAERVPAHSIQRILEVMVQMKILRYATSEKAGTWYIPAPRKPGT